MTRNEIATEVRGIFRKLFDDESIEIHDEMTSADIEEWDSLEHINLIVMIERRFNIKFSMNEALKLKNIGEMISLIEQKIR
ncbi:acyl carrier protein [Clostridia bacterium]|nr:acyl carrier protein [Clostridia bacterium]